jgi:sec1 family domain-containing protein 1
MCCACLHFLHCYCYYRLRSNGRGSSSDAAAVAAARARSPPREVIVFVIGSGSYAEYQNLQDCSQRRAAVSGSSSSSSLSITYGCTELLNAEGFLQQLAELGVRTKARS